MSNQTSDAYHGGVDTIKIDGQEIHIDPFQAGFICGLRAFAYWNDGMEYVGTCGTTLKDAIRDYIADQDVEKS